MPSFTYEQLNQNRHEIRLLQLILPQSKNEPFSDNTTAFSKLRLRLKCQALDEAPDYRRTRFSGLSYCWNPLQKEPPSMHDIQINDDDFRVGYNLYDALKSFERKLVTEWLWIDAICINQQDDTKKTWQIQQMRDIYQKAETVYIWLGNGTATDQIMDFISEIGPEAVDFQGAGMTDPSRRQLNANLYRLAVILNLDGDDEMSARTRFIVKIRDKKALWTKSCVTEGLRLIMTNAYWTRIWVMQEVSWAANIVLMSGGKVAPLRHFEETLGTFKFCGELFNIASIDLPSRLLSVPLLDLHRKFTSEHPSLKVIMWQIEKDPQRPHRTSTDPRDLVLGPVGILSLEEVEALSVDCSATLKEIFIKVTRLFLRHERDDFTEWRYDCADDGEQQWRCFTLANCPPREAPDETESGKDSIPTWVPD